MNGENERQEIIIIKRGGEGEEGHHGGAWKIAFADFMTAMMALFLVLWLVNAANEETKKAVASYFNPVKLVDRNQSKKGLDEQSGGPSQGEEHGASATVPAPPEKPLEPHAADATASPEGAFFKDPFASLEEIADAEHKRQAAGKAGGGDNASKVEGEADPFPDPFDPKQVLAKTEPDQPADKPEAPAPEQQDHGEKLAAEVIPDSIKTAATDVGLAGTLPEKAAANAKSVPEPGSAEVRSASSGEKAKEERKRMIEAIAEKVRENVEAEIALAFDDKEAMKGALTVKAVEDGVLISVTDVLNYPMFEIGSSVPRGRIVLAMEKIGQVLAKQTGPLRIYGHTDARPYKSGSGDNWQLSSQRALAAYYMLARAGLDERRVTQVTGYADRVLREAGDPNADVNRRIELLLEVK